MEKYLTLAKWYTDQQICPESSVGIDRYVSRNYLNLEFKILAVPTDLVSINLFYQYNVNQLMVVLILSYRVICMGPLFEPIRCPKHIPAL